MEDIAKIEFERKKKLEREELKERISTLENELQLLKQEFYDHIKTKKEV